MQSKDSIIKLGRAKAKKKKHARKCPSRIKCSDQEEKTTIQNQRRKNQEDILREQNRQSDRYILHKK
jgi:hypothetical protein